MAGGGPKPGKTEGGVEEEYEDPQQGGGTSVGVRIFLKRCCSVGNSLWHGTSRVLGGFQDQVAR